MRYNSTHVTATHQIYVFALAAFPGVQNKFLDSGHIAISLMVNFMTMFFVHFMWTNEIYVNLLDIYMVGYKYLQAVTIGFRYIMYMLGFKCASLQ